MPNLVKSINLTDDDKATLESILHQSTVEARTYIRAKILLLKSECRSNEFIADKLDICVTAVRLCIDKYNTGGIEAALQDNRGRGRKAEITDADITWVINKACQKPKDFGYSAELWYPASFTRFINSIAEQEGHPRMASVTETTCAGYWQMQRFVLSRYLTTVRNVIRILIQKCMMSSLFINSFPCSLMRKGTSGLMKGCRSIPCPMMKSPGCRRWIPLLTTGRLFRVQEKTARYTRTMNMCGWARCHCLQPLTCLPVRQSPL